MPVKFWQMIVRFRFFLSYLRLYKIIAIDVKISQIKNKLTQPLSSVVRQEEQIKTSNCDELGYQTQGDSNGGVVLPCTGESTLPLRGQEGFDSETKQEEIKEFQ